MAEGGTVIERKVNLSDPPPSMYFDFDVLPPPEPEIERLRKQLTEAVETSRAADARLSKANVAHAQEVLGLRRELDTLQTELAEQQAASDAVCAELEAENSRLTRELEIAQSKEARLLEAEQMVQTTTKARDLLEDSVRELRKERVAAAASLATQTSNLTVAEARAIAAETQVQRLTEQLAELRAEQATKLRTFSAEKEGLEREHRATQERLEQTGPVIDTLAAEKVRLSQGLDALRSVHQEHLELAAKEKEEADRQHRTFKESAAVAEEKRDAAVGNLASLECENDRLQLKLAAADEALAHARVREQELEDALAKQVLQHEKSHSQASSPTRTSPLASSTRKQKPQIRSELQLTEHMVEEIFQKFDVDGDGYHSLDESRALTRLLINSDVSESDFQGLCEDLGADPTIGLSLHHFTTMYTDSAFGADAKKDYKKVFGKASPR